MLITPMPGANRDNLIQLVRDIRTGAGNARSARHGPLLGYFDWVNGAVRRLRGQIRPADVERLVQTRGYDRLLAVSTSSHTAIDDETSATILHGLLNTELDQRVAELEEVCHDLETTIQRWSRGNMYLLFDTSVFIHWPDALDKIDLKQLLDGTEATSFHLLIPIVVVDELDNSKFHGKTEVRNRARHTLAILDRALEQGEPLANNLTVEVVFDPPHHVRLPIPDDEIIERAQAITALTATPLTLVTYDTHQSSMARAGGLPVRKLAMPPDPEPDGPSRNQQRRQRRERNNSAPDSNQAAPADANTA